MDLHTKTISQLKKLYQTKKAHPVDVIEQLSAQIEKQNSQLGAYLGTYLELALKAAKQADLNLPLGGIPIAIKDNIQVEGQACSCASKFLEIGNQALYDATVISRLKQAGAIPFGRTNMDEFAMGSTTENSAFQTCQNPQALGYIPGGSSGGSAAAVSANLAIVALGSDTGGSIRQPASHCGVVGLKPSYGRLSRYGLVAFASSLDQIGPLTKSVEDAVLILQATTGFDPFDSTSSRVETPDYAEKLNTGVKGLKLGLPKEYFESSALNSEIREATLRTLGQLEKLGAKIVEISLPNSEYALATYYIIAPAEASSNLSRFDGIRYGKREGGDSSIQSLYTQSRSQGFGPEVKRRIILGTYVLSAGYADKYYYQAQKARQLITQDYEKAFNLVDAIITPTVPQPARKIGENVSLLENYFSDLLTIPANLAKLPSISIPNTLIQKEGQALPVGIQITTAAFNEPILFQVAQAIEDL